MSKLAISVKGQGEWEFDDSELTLADAFAIKSATGLALKPFLEGVGEMDPHCLRALIWFVRGKDVKLEKIDFRLSDVEVEQIEESDPTSGSETPSPDAASTSTSSPSATASRRNKSTR